MVNGSTAGFAFSRLSSRFRSQRSGSIEQGPQGLISLSPLPLRVCGEQPLKTFTAGAERVEAQRNQPETFFRKVLVVVMDSVSIAPTMVNNNDFHKVFVRLKSILQPYIKKMDIAHDSQTYFLLNTRHIMRNKQPLCFAGVRQCKSYVSFYLMSVYACPAL